MLKSLVFKFFCPPTPCWPLRARPLALLAGSFSLREEMSLQLSSQERLSESSPLSESAYCPGRKRKGETWTCFAKIQKYHKRKNEKTDVNNYIQHIVYYQQTDT